MIEPELEVRRCRVPFRLHLASGSDDPENVGSTWMDLALEKFRVFAEEIDHGDEPPNDRANVLDNGTRRGTALKRCVSLRKARASGGTRAHSLQRIQATGFMGAGESCMPRIHVPTTCIDEPGRALSPGDGKV